MLAVASPLRSANIGTDERAPDGVGGAFSSDAIHLADDGLLDSIDFTGFFQGLGDDLVDVLPETHFSISHDTFFPELPYTTAAASVEQIPDHEKELPPPVPTVTSNPSSGQQNPTPPQAKASHRRKKGKVEWTPELHRKFVQAVEQLGVEKAVPSRILELMGIHSLTRHNVASHLQKYRSQRKHLLAREAEAASWTQRRGVGGGGGGGFTPRENNSSWLSPTMGFPPPLHAPYMRPLHVWGHPTVGRPTGLMGPWPSPAPHWPHQPPNYLNYWQTLYHGDLRQEWGPTAAVTALPLFPQPPAFVMRFASPTVSVVPPHAENFVPQWKQQSSGHPSKESIDAAIEEVLEKPWLPLPLGLKAPSTESVLVELQKQGVPKVPPSLQC